MLRVDHWKGGCLEGPKDSLTLAGGLSAGEILPRLPTKRIGRRYLWVQSCHSTNDLAADLARAGEAEGLVVVADSQVRGRGQFPGRSWHSPPSVNLYFSIVLRPACAPSQATLITLLSGVVLAKVAREIGAVPHLKWPNDLLLSTPAGLRKAAGVLTEISSEIDRVKHVVVGIGINVNMLNLPPKIAQKATSIAKVVGHVVDRRDLLVRVLSTFEAAYLNFCTRGPRAVLLNWQRFAILGQRCRVTYRGYECEGIALNINSDGALRFRDDTGRVHRITLFSEGEMELETAFRRTLPQSVQKGPLARRFS